MINLRARKKYFYYSLIRRVVTTIAAIPVAVYGIYCFVLALLNNETSIASNQLMLIWLSIPLVSINLCFIVFDAFYKKYLRHNAIYEFYEIVCSVKLPKSLPKVVYVYTCHNDMMKARLLQNSMQTYVNFEVWVSEGSEKLDVIEESRLFALQNNFHFFAVGGKGSSNKAENLNAFLKYSGVTFDYLMITDADEALDKNFVKYAIRCFYWKKFKNLGYVSPLNYNYLTPNLYGNIFSNADNVQLYKNDFSKQILLNDTVNLYGASCLISNKLLQANNGVFPSGCLEDYFLESFALRNGFSGIIIPISNGGQLYDKNVFANAKRCLRCIDWAIFLFKEKKLSKYNEKYGTWFTRLTDLTIKPLRYLIRVLIITFFVWIIIVYRSIIFRNAFFLFALASACCLALAGIITSFVEATGRSTMNKYWWLFYLLYWAAGLYQIPYLLKHYFDSMFRGKYSSFGGSHQKSKIKNPNRKNLISLLLIFLVIVVAIALLSILYCCFFGFNNIWVLFSFILLMVLFGTFGVSFLCTLLLFICGLIKHKKYDVDKFVYPNPFYKFEKIKNRFLNENIDKKELDLSVILS